VLAKLASSIAEEQSNIINVSVDEAPDTATTVYFTIEVNNRAHLAKVLRGLRHIPEVIRITRLKDTHPHRNQ
jgi:guanosine-3',5'-bis(diphosphate) 3'-pyrophosphohydrolase